MRLVGTTVVRGATDVHGELFVLDLSSRELVRGLVLRHGVGEGRGGPRGLRGVVCDSEGVLVATWDEVWRLDPRLRLQRRAGCPALQHAHEVALDGDRLWVVSTDHDSLLALDVGRWRFEEGLCLRPRDGRLRLTRFDPHEAHERGARLHLNQVSCAGGLHLSGRHLPWLVRVDDGLQAVAELPAGTHNARLSGGALLYSDTESDRLAGVDAQGPWAIPAPRHAPEQLEGLSDIRVARQGFVRGLVELGGGLVAGGSSPAMVVVYDTIGLRVTDVFPITRDVRHAVHGLAVWPWEMPGGERVEVQGLGRPG